MNDSKIYYRDGVREYGQRSSDSDSDSKICYRERVREYGQRSSDLGSKYLTRQEADDSFGSSPHYIH